MKKGDKEDMLKKIEDFLEFIIDNFEMVFCMTIVIIFIILFLSIPLAVYCDYKIKNRALDIYENNGVEINIHDLDNIMKGE